MNAAALSCGMAQNGRTGGKAALEAFWKEIAEEGRFGPFARLPIEKFWLGWNPELAPSFVLYDLLSKFLSPYQLNPFNFNPLRRVLAKHVDFEAVARYEPIKLFISATHVKSGKIRVFDAKSLSVDAILASACLPTIFQTVYVEGEPYWDGGYMGNPAIFPLIYGTLSRDVIIVQVNPIHRPDVPQSSADIADRVNEISFNSSLMREMRAIEFVSRLVEVEKLDETRYKRMLIHMIEAEQEMCDLGLASKLGADWDFICYLRDIGRNAADKWLRQNWDAIGERPSLDIRKEFL